MFDRITVEPTSATHSGAGTRFAAILGGKQIGSLVLDTDGEIAWVGIRREHRRKGLARALLTHATALGYAPRHSPCRSPEGDAWARSVGGILPPLHSLPCARCAEPA